MSRGIIERSEQAVALTWVILLTVGREGKTAPFNNDWKCDENEDTQHDHSDETGSAYLSNGRTLEEQKEFDRLAYRLSEFLGNYDKIAVLSRLPARDGLAKQKPDNGHDERSSCCC